MIVFDLTLTSKDDISECFRVFTDPDKIPAIPAVRERHPLTQVYTDGTCMNNEKPTRDAVPEYGSAQTTQETSHSESQERNSPFKLEK